jgi:RNA polymerase sigma-70 factor (ECF subfamily)
MSAVTTALGPKDATFEEHRSLLFGVAYRMLGSVAEAEDAVQDAYLRYRGADGDIANPRAYLVTIVTRLCLDLLKSARVQREQYIGPWLPEPIVHRDGAPATPEEVVASEDNISMAFLVMLEELGPAERAVFLLREVFDYDYGDIAPMVNKSEAACRQVFRRAREHIAQRQHRFTANYDQRRVLTAQFLQAANEGNMAGLMQLLSADVTAYSDGGGKAVAATRPIFGPDRIARFVIGVARKDPPALVEMADVNGVPGVLLRDRRGRVHTVMVLELDAEGRIATVYSMRNPDKLRRIA